MAGWGRGLTTAKQRKSNRNIHADTIVVHKPAAASCLGCRSAPSSPRWTLIGPVLLSPDLLLQTDSASSFPLVQQRPNVVSKLFFCLLFCPGPLNDGATSCPSLWEAESAIRSGGSGEDFQPKQRLVPPPLTRCLSSPFLYKKAAQRWRRYRQ